jgi:membrane protease YdiL (CAAX protease family)
MHLRGNTERPHELDQAVASPRPEDGISWELAVAMAVGWLALTELGAGPWVSSQHLSPLLKAFVGLGLEASVGVVVFVAVWLAEVPGGWGRVATVGRLQRGDARTIGLWTTGQFGARFAVLVVLASAAPGVGRGFVSNNPVAMHLAPGALAVSIASGVLVAPVAEEILCRGLLLRAVMRRYGFWAGAIASSVVFGLAHARSQTTAGAAFVIVVSTALFGVIQCVLVRRTGRLGPAIGVHALGNAVGGLLAIGN